MKLSDLEMPRPESGLTKEALLVILISLVIFWSIFGTMLYLSVPSVVSMLLEYVYDSAIVYGDSYRVMTGTNSSGSSRDYFVDAYENGLVRVPGYILAVVICSFLTLVAFLILMLLGLNSKYHHVKSVLQKNGYASQWKTVVMTFTSLKLRAGVLVPAAILFVAYALHHKYLIDIRPEVGRGTFIDESSYVLRSGTNAYDSAFGTLVNAQSGSPFWVGYKKHELEGSDTFGRTDIEEKEQLVVSVFDIKKGKWIVNARSELFNKQASVLPKEKSYLSYIDDNFLYTMDRKMQNIWKIALDSSAENQNQLIPVTYSDFSALYGLTFSYVDFYQADVIGSGGDYHIGISFNDGTVRWLDTKNRSVSQTSPLSTEAESPEQEIASDDYRVRSLGVKSYLEIRQKSTGKYNRRDEAYIDGAILSQGEYGVLMQGFVDLSQDSASYLELIDPTGRTVWRTDGIVLKSPDRRGNQYARVSYTAEIIGSRIFITGKGAERAAGYYMINLDDGKIEWKFQVPLGDI